jgi:hypothetical protein
LGRNQQGGGGYGTTVKGDRRAAREHTAMRAPKTRLPRTHQGSILGPFTSSTQCRVLMAAPDVVSTTDGEVEWIRTTVTRRVAETSLRQVSRGIGMSPSGLQKFMDGSRPYSNTLLKLRTWYVRHLAQDVSVVTTNDAHSALLLLTQGLHGSGQREVVLSTLANLARAFGPHPPAWIELARQAWDVE